MIRPRPVLAIAWRDLRTELAGRTGMGLPIISLALLLPAALLGGPSERVPRLLVQGDVPEAVMALPGAEVDELGTVFVREDDVTVVTAYRIPESIREVLDDGAAVVVVEELDPPMRIPGRSLLLALVSASTLTGSVASSIGGERARHTLQALLSAAVTRLEIVVGKWLAWTTFGTVGVLVACAAALFSGRLEPGPWLLAMPVVPALTVAIGLWLVRRTTDVVAGTSVSLRVMPAVLGATGLLSWMLSSVSDLVAAAVPMGGALMVAGNLWQGALLPTAVGLLTSIALTGFLLHQTALDLEEQPRGREPSGMAPLSAGRDGALAGALWLTLVAGPVLWGWAGNPTLTELLGVSRGLMAGGLMLLTIAVIRGVRELDVAGLPPLGRVGWSAAGAMGIGLVATLLPAPTSTNPWLVLVAERLQAGIVPSGPVLVLVILAQEVWFRGWIQSRAGWVPAAIAWTVAISPHDPLTGLVTGLALGWAGRDGLLNALAARFGIVLLTLAWATLG